MGRKSRLNSIAECIGPRWYRPGISRSMSGSTDMRNSKGMFMFTFRILDAVFPDRYPRARCPTAYIVVPSNIRRLQFR